MLKNKFFYRWRKDAKWLCGLLLFIVFFVTTAFGAAFQLTSEKTAVDAMSTGMAFMFSRSGIDNETDIAEASFRPIPGLRVTVNK